MNDDEAGIALARAKQLLRKGDFSGAHRWATKAHRMFSDESSSGLKSEAARVATEALQKTNPPRNGTADADNSKFSSSANTAAETPAPAEDGRNSSVPDGIRQRQTSGPNNSDQPPTSASVPTYSPAIERKCKQILQAKDFYQLLGVERSCTNDEIKKAYRKLALQLHPDKAKCPSAEAAFKELSRAYQCLSSEQSRRVYDEAGHEAFVNRGAAGNRQTQQRTYTFREEMTPEELFRQFFFGDPFSAMQQQRRVYRARTTTRVGEQAQEQNARVVIHQLLPLIIVMLLTFFSGVFRQGNTPAYSTRLSTEFPIRRTSFNYKVPYFVDRDFFDRFPISSPQLQNREIGLSLQLEVEIELDHFGQLCSTATAVLQRQLHTLSALGSWIQYRRKAAELREAENRNEACRNYHQIRKAYPQIAYKNDQRKRW